MVLDASKVISGTWGEVWLDDEQLAEAYGLQAKINLTKDEIALCGVRGKNYKINGWEGKGSLKLHKVNSLLIKKLSASLKEGKEVVCSIISKLKDPTADGAERIVLKGVVFDDLTLIDWEAKKNGTLECPFTFSDFELLDVI